MDDEHGCLRCDISRAPQLTFDRSRGSRAAGD
jgi:hypothetical protein